MADTIPSESTIYTIFFFLAIFLPLGMFIAAFPGDLQKAVSVWSAVLVTVVMFNAMFYVLYSRIQDVGELR